MKLENAFTVPVPPAEAWAVLLDVERIAPCMPGATLETVDGDSFTGRVKVKVGPINLTYKGEARFSSLDESAHVAVIEGRGKETRGPGTATATVTCRLRPEGSGTRVDVETDLAVTGKPAQFGRGVLADVSGKLVDQFASCLSDQLAGGGADAPAAEHAAPSDGGGAGRSPRAAIAGSVADGTLPGQSSPETTTAGQATVEPRPPAHAAPGPAPVETGVAPSGEAASEALTSGRSAAAAAGPSGPAASDSGPAASHSGPAAGSSGPPSGQSGPRRVVQQQEAEPIDLLGTAGAPVLKRAAPALGVLALLIVLLGWRRRRS